MSQMHVLHCRMHEGFLDGTITAVKARILSPFRETACQSRGAPHHEFSGAWAP